MKMNASDNADNWELVGAQEYKKHAAYFKIMSTSSLIKYARYILDTWSKVKKHSIAFWYLVTMEQTIKRWSMFLDISSIVPQNVLFSFRTNLICY